jgi:hypothetical protein
MTDIGGARDMILLEVRHCIIITAVTGDAWHPVTQRR